MVCLEPWTAERGALEPGHPASQRRLELAPGTSQTLRCRYVVQPAASEVWGPPRQAAAGQQLSGVELALHRFDQGAGGGVFPGGQAGAGGCSSTVR